MSLFSFRFLPLGIGCTSTPLFGALLHQTDFNSRNPRPALATFMSGATTATAALPAAGPIDTADAVASSAVTLKVDASRATGGAWSAGVTSGRLAVANSEVHLGKLTLGFDLATSLVRPVRVRIQSFASANAAAPIGTAPTCPWLRNGVALAGETDSSLYRAAASDTDTGDYTLRVINAFGPATSAVARVTLDPAASRLISLSCRTSLAPGAPVIPGFTIAGSGRKTVLIRAIGPGLAPFGLNGLPADPQLRVFKDTAQIAANDNWDAAEIGDAFTRVGAFPLPATSRDSALLATLDASGGYTVQVSDANSGSGGVLVEIYDADTAAAPTSRLSNVSVRGPSGSAASALILGLVLNGNGARALLARGAGPPALAAIGVLNPLADPQLTVFAANRRALLGNDDWGSYDFSPQLETARVLAGAFAFRSASRDSALIASLAAGSYSVQVSATGTSTVGGEALAEIHELP